LANQGAKKLAPKTPVRSTRTKSLAVKSDKKKTPAKTPAARKTPIRAPKANAELLRLILKSLDDDKAENIVSIDLKGRTPMADHIVIASGRSARHVSAIAEHLLDTLGKTGLKAKVEGLSQGDWVLVDALDAIVHVFRPEVRAFYNLEKMWGEDAPSAEAV
jgi:ribosome-associated protein